MLAVWRKQGRQLETITAADARTALGDVIWIDAINPAVDEAEAVRAATGLHVASEAELSEIEVSSRLSESDGALYLSLPWVSQNRANETASAPIGFALSADRLLSVRFAPIAVIDSYAERLRQNAPPVAGPHAFVGLLEAMVDGIADRLERTHADLDVVSRRIFRSQDVGGPSARSAELRQQLRTVGQAGETISGIRDTLLAFGRMVPYVSRSEVDWVPHELRPRLKTLRQDVASLNDYDTHLTDKVQFLLDAILGFINIEQSNIIKLMTVVGVIGVPPTLIASIYGMNFENMPELHWRFGYPVALFVMFLSAVIPVLWFRRRGWL